MKIFDNNDHLRTHKQVLLLPYKYFDNLLEPGVAWKQWQPVPMTLGSC